MNSIYINPFDWDFVDDNTLIYDGNGKSEEEIKEMINEALNEALEDAVDSAVDGAVDEAISNMDIKLEGQNLLYKLIVNGNENGEINIPKDQFLKSTSYDSENKKLIFVMETAEGETTTEVSMNDLVAAIEEKNQEQDTVLADKADKSELDDLATKAEVEAVDAKVDAIVVPDVSGLAVKSEVTEEINSAVDTLNQAIADKADASALDDLATKAEVETVDAKVNAIVVPDVSGLAVKSEVTEEINAAVAGIVIPDVSEFATKTYVDEAVAGVVVPDISGLAVKSEVTEEINSAVDTLNQAIADKADASALDDLATKAEVEAVDAKVDAIEIPDVSGFAVKSEVTEEIATAIADKADKNEIPDVSGFAVASEVTAEIAAAVQPLATKSEVETATANAIAQIVATAPEDLDTLKEVADYIASDKTKAAEIETKLSQHDAAIEAKADQSEVDTLATKAELEEVDEKVDAIVVPDVSGFAVASEVTTQIANAVADKANVSDIPTRTSELENDSNFITSHQSLEEYAKKAYVSEKIAEVVGGAPETLDTLKEIADALSSDEGTLETIAAAIETKANADDVYTKGNIDDKIGDLGVIVEVEGQEATYWEDGDELPEGVEVGDVKTPAVEEVTREKSVKEYVDESVQTVNEKPEVMVLERKYGALLSLLNLRDTDVNNVIVNQELAESNTVTYNNGSIDNIIVPETTKSKTITAELEPDTDLTLTSRYGVTINNTGEQPTDLTVTAPAVENYNAATITLNGGEYDTITVTDASLTVQNGASVQNVVITQETTKNLTINAMFAEGATVTSASNAAITLTSKNPEGEEVSVVLDAPGSTVTMNNGNWVNVEASVSQNTLIINNTVHIENLNVTQGNVTVKVARQADIANVVEDYTLAAGCTIDYLHDDITASNVSKLTSTGTHTLVEDIAKNGRFAPGIFASDDIVWNLNGHNITFTNTQGYANFLLRGSLHLEINGEGNVINNAGDYGFWTATEGAKVVINGGHFEAATHVLYAEKGTIEVNGGSFKLTNPDECDKDANGNFKFLLNCRDENYTAGTANIIVRGGKFYGFNPAVTYGEPSGPVSYVADGYGVVESTEMIDGVEHKVYEVKPINE